MAAKYLVVGGFKLCRDGEFGVEVSLSEEQSEGGHDVRPGAHAERGKALRSLCIVEVLRVVERDGDGL